MKLHSLYLFFITILMIFLSGNLFSQQTVKTVPDGNSAFAEKWEWALQDAQKTSPNREFWIATSITRDMGVDEFIWSNGDIFAYMHGHHESDQPSLSLILKKQPDASSGVSEAEQLRMAAENALQEAKGLRATKKKVPQEIALMFQYRGKSKRLGDAHNIAIVSMALPFDFDRQVVYWVGNVAQSASLPMFKRMYAEARKKRQREQLISIIGMHDNANEVIPFLDGVLKSDETADVREEAAEWLGWQQDVRAVKILVRTARDDRSLDVREEAVEALGQSDLPAAEKALISFATESRDVAIRENAVEALAYYPGEKSLTTLKKVAFEDPKVDVQEEAVSAIAYRKDDASYATLKAILENHRRPDVREEALDALASYKRSDLPGILKHIAFNDRDEDVQEEAIELMVSQEIGDPLSTLTSIIRTHPNPEIKETAVEVLAHLAADKAVAVLEETIKDSDDRKLKLNALNMLLEMDDNAGIPKLIEIGKTHQDRSIRKRAIMLLGETEDPRAIDALIEIAGAE